MAELQYEPIDAARPVHVEDHAGSRRVIVRMQGLYVPVPGWAREFDVLALVLWPTCWLVVLLGRALLRLPKPPRAEFEVSATRVACLLRDPSTGEATRHDWPRDAVAELRVNRYESGLWVDVFGHVKDTFLADLPRDVLEQLEAALAAALAETSARDDGSTG
jgi:hypothetical protein